MLILEELVDQVRGCCARRHSRSRERHIKASFKFWN